MMKDGDFIDGGNFYSGAYIIKCKHHNCKI